ncbi:Uncharacterised protein [Orientia tsutsugamushi]|nr:Uncharacterised protein [Orientia tsutsugamushi]
MRLLKERLQKCSKIVFKPKLVLLQCSLGNDFVLNAIGSLTKVLIWIEHSGKVKLKLVK